MTYIKAYYTPGEGYQLFLPDGSLLPGIGPVSVHDEWVEAGSKCGRQFINTGHTTATLRVEIVNEPPRKNLS